MTNYYIVPYYLAFNIAYKDEGKANREVFDYSHKGEKVKMIYVIVENGNAPYSFNTDSNDYLYYDQYIHAVNEIKELEK